MGSAFSKALAQMPEPTFRRVLFMSLALTVVLLVGIGVLLNMAFGMIDRPEWLPDWEWLTSTLEWIASLGIALSLTVLLFPVATLFIGLFLDQIADAVEEKHYSNDPPSRDVPLLENLIVALKYTGWMIGLNILFLVFYVLPVANIVIFLALNGLLLSREYFNMIAMRHVDRHEADRLRRENGTKLFIAGVIIALPLMIPIVNLLMPLFGTAFMVHVFKDIHRKSGGSAMQTT